MAHQIINAVIVGLCSGMVREANLSLHTVMTILFITTVAAMGKLSSHLSNLALILCLH